MSECSEVLSPRHDMTFVGTQLTASVATRSSQPKTDGRELLRFTPIGGAIDNR